MSITPQFSNYIDPLALVAERRQYDEASSELAVLACVAERPSIAREVFAVCRVEHFSVYGEVAKLLSMMSLKAERLGVPMTTDDMSLAACQSEFGIQISPATMEFLAGVRGRSAPDGWRLHAETVREAAGRRWLYDFMRACQLHLGERPVTDTLAGVRGKLDILATRFTSVQPDDLHAAGVAFLNDPASRRRFPNGRFPGFVGTLGAGGLRPGSMTLLSGRSKAGKSMLLANLILGFADLGTPVLWLDTEMSATEQAERLLVLLAGPDGGDGALERLRVAGQCIRFIRPPDFASALGTIREFGAQTRGMGVVVHDWLRPDFSFAQNPRMAEWQLLGEMAGALKQVAGETGLPVIVANQENRGAIGASHSDRMSGGERYMSGADRIVHLCTASCSIFRVAAEAKDAMVGEFGVVVASHVLAVDVNRFGLSHVPIPLLIENMKITEVADPRVGQWLECWKVSTGGPGRSRRSSLLQPPATTA